AAAAGNRAAVAAGSRAFPSALTAWGTPRGGTGGRWGYPLLEELGGGTSSPPSSETDPRPTSPRAPRKQAAPRRRRQTAHMGHWLQRNIIEPGKLPMLLALSAFVLTFVATRTITRLIRAGHGPFGNVKAGGLHIHHVVPGVVLIVV